MRLHWLNYSIEIVNMQPSIGKYLSKYDENCYFVGTNEKHGKATTIAIGIAANTIPILG